MKRVLLTGAFGAIGLHMFDHLLQNTDWELILIDSFRHKGYYDRITNSCKDHPEYASRFSTFHHDLVAPFTEREVEKLGKIDYIINLASLSDVQASIDNPVYIMRNNCELMFTMLELSRALKPEVFLHFSTDEVYGSTPKIGGGHKEWDKIKPSNPYAASKAAQEAFAISYWRSFGVPLIITNTMNNFGETQSPSKFPAMIQQKINADQVIDVHATVDGEIGTRYYLHSRNAADAVMFILKNVPPVAHQPGQDDEPVRLNIVGDKQVSNLELVQIIGKLMGKEPRYELKYFHASNPGHDLHYGLNGEKLAALGWKSPKSFEESLANTIEWQQTHPEWMK